MIKETTGQYYLRGVFDCTDKFSLKFLAGSIKFKVFRLAQPYFAINHYSKQVKFKLWYSKDQGSLGAMYRLTLEDHLGIKFSKSSKNPLQKRTII